MSDILITGGTVIDGTGNPSYPATVAVEGDRVRILHGNGELPAAGPRAFQGDKPSPARTGRFRAFSANSSVRNPSSRCRRPSRSSLPSPPGRLGLSSRGILRDGFSADITVFDPDRVGALATYDQPRQQSTGVEYVLVDGSLVLDRGKPTGSLPGRALWRGE